MLEETSDGRGARGSTADGRGTRDGRGPGRRDDGPASICDTAGTDAVVTGWGLEGAATVLVWLTVGLFWMFFVRTAKLRI